MLKIKHPTNNYIWEDEEKHFQEAGKPADHIFIIIQQLNKLLI